MEANPKNSNLNGGSRYLSVAIGLTLIVIPVFLLAGFGTRLGWWHFKTGFLILKYGFYAAVASLLIGAVGLYQSRRTHLSKVLVKAVPMMVVLLVSISIPLKYVWKASHVPRIHDITTDFENPPLFKAVLPLRSGSPNSTVYAGESLALLQKKGYPDLKPLFLPLPSDQAFQKVLEKVEKSHWKIVESNSNEMRIEATATTFWFGFKDDIVIRVAPAEGGSRVDLRSLSRVGLSDVGANAERIRCFIDQFTRQS
jgi:uncharacterized protein (DUF1499 family)